MESTETKQSSWLDAPIFGRGWLNWELAFWVLILVLAIFSRFYILGARVMSHDENSHVYYSWRFFQGQGFAHDPLMHGPLQFHLLAGSYFMFGDNDFTGRLPQALCSIATVMFMWYYRRYLGRAGAMVAAVLMLISPYMLYYGRYARNEAFVALFGVITIWAILRYLETGLPRYLYWVTLATVLHFTSKETSFIYMAQGLVFLGLYFIYRISLVEWPRPEYRNRFLLALIAFLVIVGLAGGYMMYTDEPAAAPLAQPAQPLEPGVSSPVPEALTSSPPSTAIWLLLIFGLALLGLAMYYLLRGYTVARLRLDRPFSLMLVQFMLVLPQLSAFPVRFMGWDIPTNAGEVMALTSSNIMQIGLFLVPLFILSFAIGLYWNRREWLINAAIWYGVFTVFYTSLFTNGAGFFTGMVGSLGYWLEQQGVQRGSQPLYYYALVQVPVYEYLPMIGTWLAFGLALWGLLRRSGQAQEPLPAAEALPESDWQQMSAGAAAADALERQAAGEPLDGTATTYIPGRYSAADYSPADDDGLAETTAAADAGQYLPEPAPTFALLAFWSVTSLVAFSIAGEKMPWLTVHITLPAILLTAWALGKLIDATDWSLLRERRGWLVLALLPVFILSFLGALGALLGNNPPFQGKELGQLQATGQFLLSLLAAGLSGAGILYLIRSWPTVQFVRVLTLSFFALLALLTARTAITANYYAYDNANELLVYAHSAPGVKIALDQIEEISRRTTDGLGIQVAYDNETSYPYWWYLRNYPNAQYYGTNPSRALRDAPIILVGDANFGKIEPVVANLYDRFDYIRLWWPNQDYFDLTPQSVWKALSNREMRNALFQIWLNRDYTAFGKVVGRDMSLPAWSPSAHMRLYIRKDITSKLWNYGAAPAPQAALEDPFEKNRQSLTAERVIGGPGTQAGQFNRPRDLAVAPDGTLYVADTENHRIQHLAPNGEVLHVWGGFTDAAQGAAQPGLFNQPWGLAVGPDGSVYVADTWNHRVQKFTPSGEFIQTWGFFGQAEQPEAFWGPRDVAVDQITGRVYVTDTGNKRVVVFDADGNYLAQFGGPGMEPGQLDEPVGVAVDRIGLVYVADTWNQRIQIFELLEDGRYVPSRSWEVNAWFGQSLDNKPYIGIDLAGESLFAADPEGYRVLQYSLKGEPLLSWGDYGTSPTSFGLPASAAPDGQGGVWVTDAGNSRIMYFVLPKK